MSNPDQWFRLSDMPITEASEAQPSPYAIGRRMRIFQRLAFSTFHRYVKDTPVPTVGELCAQLADSGLYTVEQLSSPTYGGDATLHFALQDLGDDINMDEHDAAEAAFIGTPFAGVDDGIVPVTDEHVRLAIPAMQRELDRELRAGPDGKRLPSLPLGELPWPIQRALVERRRLRYQQFGITREVWKRGTWSLWDVPLDDGYIPARSVFEHAGGVAPSDAMADLYDYMTI